MSTKAETRALKKVARTIRECDRLIEVGKRLEAGKLTKADLRWLRKAEPVRA